MVRVSGVPYDVDLPKQKVRLVSYTPQIEQTIAYLARVSNPANQGNEEYEQLIRYLIRHEHWSPFEMASVTMEINCTRDIGRQILRHRSFTFQEFSQRYAESQDWEVSECRLQDTKNRQNSLPCEDKELADQWQNMQEKILLLATDAYKIALENGIAKELARKLLPEGLTMSRMYMTGTLRSWIHYVMLRTKPDTQKEHRVIAQECKQKLEEICPTIMKSL